MSTSRRRFLRLCGVAGIGAVAGCSSESLTNATPASGDTATPPQEPTTAQATTTSLKNPSQQAKLVPDDGDSSDHFGSAVAVSRDGTTAIIGTPNDEDPNGTKDKSFREGAGSAYVFDGTDGSWSHQAKLAPDDGDGGDQFGHDVAVSDDGTTAIVTAAFDEDPNGTKAGSAYVFDSTDGSWSQQAKLTADDGNSDDLFGRAVAVSSDGTTAIIGAVGEEDPNPNESDQLTFVGGGAAYVFNSAGGSWSQQAKLAGDAGGGPANFGISVAMSDDGTTAIVGAWQENTANGDQAGAAYVFDSAGGSWSRRTKLTPDDAESSDRFAGSAAMSSDGTTALVTGGSAVYVFDSTGGSWSQQSKITVDGFGSDSYDTLGSSVALSSDGTVALVGAIEAIDIQEGTTSGSAYVFTGSGGSWSQQANITADDDDTNDRFGSTMAISGDSTTALIAAPTDEDPNGEFAGSAYVFE